MSGKKYRPMPEHCVDCDRVLVRRSEWDELSSDDRRENAGWRMLHKGGGQCRACYDAARRRAQGVPRRVTRTECPTCDVKLIPKTVWFTHSEEERERLRASGVHYNAGHGLCGSCYYKQKYEQEKYPGMTAGPLEDVPDELVHPEHLRFRARQRYFREVSRRV